MNHWIDAHNHLLDPRLGNPEPMILQMRESGIDRCVLNTTDETEWSALDQLATRHPDFIIPAFGIHPWKAQCAAPEWQAKLVSLLKKHSHATVGECGLDRWVSQPDPETQKTIFLDHIKIARDLKRPLTIHCLKAWGLLFDSFAECPPPTRFLMHSFNGSIETARRLIPLGAYFSFSGHFLQPRKSSVLEVFRQLPPDRILIETDAPDMNPPEQIINHPLGSGLNHPANLPAIGQALATALGMTPAALAKLTKENFQRWLEPLHGA